MYSPVSLLSGIYPLPAMHSLLVTLDFINIKLSSKAVQTDKHIGWLWSRCIEEIELNPGPPKHRITMTALSTMLWLLFI